jgi:hypothetical protein
LSQDQLQDKVRHDIVPKQPTEYRMQVLVVAAFSGGGFSAATVEYIMTGPEVAVADLGLRRAAGTFPCKCSGH